MKMHSETYFTTCGLPEGHSMGYGILGERKADLFKCSCCRVTTLENSFRTNHSLLESVC